MYLRSNQCTNFLKDISLKFLRASYTANCLIVESVTAVPLVLWDIPSYGALDSPPSFNTPPNNLVTSYHDISCFKLFTPEDLVFVEFFLALVSHGNVSWYQSLGSFPIKANLIRELGRRDFLEMFPTRVLHQEIHRYIIL